MQGSPRKRCPCPPRRDAAGRRLSCSKPHGSWIFVVDVPPSAVAARRQVMRSGFPTRKAAEQALAEYLVEAPRGPVPLSRRQTLDDYLDGWLAGMQLSLAATAFTGYRAVLRLYARPRIGHLQLDKITAQILTRL